MKKLIVGVWMGVWLLVLGVWIFSLFTCMYVLDPIPFASYTVISGCSLILLLYLTKLDRHASCKLGLCYDWVEWKDRDDYPRFKRVCVGCGRIQELLYNMLDFDWSDC